MAEGINFSGTDKSLSKAGKTVAKRKFQSLGVAGKKSLIKLPIDIVNKINQNNIKYGDKSKNSIFSSLKLDPKFISRSREDFSKIIISKDNKIAIRKEDSDLRFEPWSGEQNHRVLSAISFTIRKESKSQNDMSFSN